MQFEVECMIPCAPTRSTNEFTLEDKARIKRNDDIIADVKRGLSIADVANKYWWSERTVNQIVKIRASNEFFAICANTTDSFASVSKTALTKVANDYHITKEQLLKYVTGWTPNFVAMKLKLNSLRHRNLSITTPDLLTKLGIIDN